MNLPALIRSWQQDVYMSLTILGCTVNCRFRFADCPLIHCDKGPKTSFHTPGLDAPFLYKLLLHILGAGEKSSPQEPKGSINYSANIADMHIPFKTICNCYTKVFDIINIFENCTL